MFDADALAAVESAGLARVADVDGVPLLLAGQDGPLTGGLVFRVGQFDETLATSGVSHMVEHLALHSQFTSPAQIGGTTMGAFVVFHAAGDETQVVHFMNEVCRSLGDLPFGQLETERRILECEGSRRGHGRIQAMSLWRFGAQGPGLVAYREEGIPMLTSEDVANWARTRFTTGNAVAFLTADALPPGLRLALPAGERIPVTLPPETLPKKPAWFVGDTDGIVLDSIVPRTAAAALFERVFRRALLRSLRQDLGLSYSASCDYQRLTGERVRIVVDVDAIAGEDAAVARGVLATLERLENGEVDIDDLAAERDFGNAIMRQPDFIASNLPSLAMDILNGVPSQSVAELIAERNEVTAGDIAEVARQFRADALAQVANEGLDWADFAPAPTHSDRRVYGSAHPHWAEPELSLTVTDRGVSVAWPETVATVMFDDCVLLRAYEDGGRVLIGRDGLTVTVEPAQFRDLDPRALTEWIDSRVPARVTKRLPSRSPDEITGIPPHAVEQTSPKARTGSMLLLALIIFVFGGTVSAFLLTLNGLGAAWQRGGYVLQGWAVTVALALVVGARAHAAYLNRAKKSG